MATKTKRVGYWSGKRRKFSICSLENLKVFGSKNRGENHFRWKGGKENKKEYLVRWRKEHKDYAKEKNKEWVERNREYKNFLNSRRDALRRGASGEHTFGEWELLKKQYNFICPSCGKKEPQIKLTQDHIVPLSKGGSENIENIQPLCQSCNSMKATKDTKF